jgi:hypothetical protein
MAVALLTCCGCDKEKPADGGKACASRRQTPRGDDGQPVASLAEAKLRAALKPATVAAYDAYFATLPEVVATVANLPVTREMAAAEMMRMQP